MGFCLLLEISAETLVEILVKTSAVNTAKNFLTIINSLQQMQLKLFQKQ